MPTQRLDRKRLCWSFFLFLLLTICIPWFRLGDDATAEVSAGPASSAPAPRVVCQINGGFCMIVQIKDILKKLAACQFGVTGKYLALHKQGESVSLRFAKHLVKGEALLLHPTAAQAAAVTGTPLSVLQNALTSECLRTPRKAREPKPASDGSATPQPQGWDARLDAIMDEVGTLPILEKLAARELAPSANGITDPASNVGAVEPNGGGIATHS
jgi:hypothetical protein